MAGSIKVLLWNQKNKDGLYPLAIRIIKNRKPSYIWLGHYIKKEQWDEEEKRVKKSHPNSTRLNNLIIAKLAEASGTVIDLQRQNGDTSAQKIKRSVTRTDNATFFKQAEDYLDNLKKSGKFNRYSPDKPRIAHFKEFLKGKDIAFVEITPGLLEKFKTFLHSYHIGKPGKKPMSERTIVNHLSVIRSVFAYARKNKLVTKDQSPFGGDDGIKIIFPDSTKVGLMPEDVQKLESVDLPDPHHDHARNLWLVSFYFAGMRVSDLLRLRWSDFNNGRLHYLMGKNDKGGSLKISAQALSLLEKYKVQAAAENELVFPELRGVDFNDEFEVQRMIAIKNRVINQTLKEIGPIAGLSGKLEMHKTRHTFGGFAGDEIPIQMLQKLYRHTHVSTTIGYQKAFTYKDADAALDAVIGKAQKRDMATVPDIVAGTFQINFKMKIEIILTRKEFDLITDCISGFQETSFCLKQGECWQRNIAYNKDAGDGDYIVMADIRELDSVILKSLENSPRSSKAKALSQRLYSLLKQTISIREEVNALYIRQTF